MKPLFVLLKTFVLTLVVTLLLGRLNVGLSGRVAMFIMLMFTALGHFRFTEGMTMMLPPQVPAKKAIIYLTGVLEIVLGLMLVLKGYITFAGFALIVFFIILLPANIYAAARKVNYEKADYTGKGLSYLWIRIPMQILFIAWVIISLFSILTETTNIKIRYMKSLMLTVMMVATFLATYAQSDKFTAAMQKTLAMFDSAKTTQDLTTVSNSFERIGDAEKTQWLPYYYAALALTNSGWADPSVDKDKNAEKITALVDKAEAIEKNAELYTIRNMAATQQMLVNPQERWQTYGQQASSALQAGMKMDPNNPRLYYLQGMSLFNTPQQFGGGKDVAKPVFEKAQQLFKAEQPKPLYPHWGQKQTEDMLEKCK